MKVPPKVPLHEISSIHFGNKNWKEFTVLTEINALSRQGQILKMKGALSDDHDTKQNSNNALFELKKKILDKIKEYSELEDTGEEAEVKFAYVVFRSMEGKARFCHAYKYDFSIPFGLKTY